MEFWSGSEKPVINFDDKNPRKSYVSHKFLFSFRDFFLPSVQETLGFKKKGGVVCEEQFYWVCISLKTQSSLLCPSG